MPNPKLRLTFAAASSIQLAPDELPQGGNAARVIGCSGVIWVACLFLFSILFYFYGLILSMTNEVFVEFLNDHSKNTLMETLEIKYDSANKEEGWLKGSMPVSSKNQQPFGLLHGGASLSLAESLGSAASLMYIDLKSQAISGISVSANHVKSKKDGTVYGEAGIPMISHILCYSWQD